MTHDKPRRKPKMTSGKPAGDICVIVAIRQYLIEDSTTKRERRPGKEETERGEADIYDVRQLFV